MLGLLARNACRSATGSTLPSRRVSDLAKLGSATCSTVDSRNSWNGVLLFGGIELQADMRRYHLLDLVVRDLITAASNRERGLLFDRLLDMFGQASEAISVAALRGKDLLKLISADVALGPL